MSRQSTNYGSLTSNGVPVLGQSKIVSSAFGRTLFVNANSTPYASPYFSMAGGNDANSGTSLSSP